MCYGENRAALFAFVQGLFIDTYSGSIFGLSAFVYLSICGFIYLMSNFIDIHLRIGNIITILLSLLLKNLLFMIIIYICFKTPVINISFLRDQILCIILTVLMSPILFGVLNGLRHDKII